MENIFYVYLHRRKTDNKVFYVGKGKNNRAFDKTNRSRWWKNVVDKHGVEVEVVFDNLPEKDALQVEKDTILEFRYFGHPLVNMTDGGEGMSGHKPSEETRAKRSKSLKGKRHSEAHRLAISKTMSKRKGLICSNADRNIYKFIHITSGNEFIGTRIDLCNTFGVSPLSLRSLFGSQPHAKTCHGWKVIKENNDTKTEEKTEEH